MRKASGPVGIQMRNAMRVRDRIGIDRGVPVSSADVVEEMGVELRYADLRSIDGIYVPNEGGLIIVSTMRPAGRRNFTIAHELGHHLGGPARTNTSLAACGGHTGRVSRAERSADLFAGLLLMPPSAVRSAFRDRGTDIASRDPLAWLEISQFIGVGYSALVTHVARTLRWIDSDQEGQLLESTPQSILAGQGHTSSNAQAIWLVDETWHGRPVDVEVGDQVIVSLDVDVDGVSVIEADTGVKAVEAGLARIHSRNGFATFVRVSRRGYVGRARFRHLREASL